MTDLTIDQALQQAIAHHLAGELQEAEFMYRAILQVQPDHPDATRNLGLLLSQRLADQLKEAHSLYHSILETTPEPSPVAPGAAAPTSPAGGLNNAPAHTGHTATFEEQQALVELFETRRFDAFEAAAQQLIRRYPQDGFGFKAYGTVLAQFKHYDQALSVLEQALVLNRRDSDIHNTMGVIFGELGRWYDAHASYRQALAIDPNYARAHNNLGTVLKHLGNTDEAEVCYRRALELQPDFAEPCNNLGILFKERGRLDEAEAIYRRALAVFPDSAEIHNNLSTALQGLKRLPEAEAECRRALELKPDYAEAYNNLGTILRDQRRLEDAEDSFRQALALQLNYAEALSNLGIVLMEQERLDEAESSGRMALMFDPSRAEAHGNLGNVLSRLGRWDEAESSYRQALVLAPEQAKAHSNLATVLRDLGRLDEAEASCREALRLDPTLAEAHHNLGVVFKDSNRLSEAEACCRQALVLDPEYAEAYFNLGNVLRELGRLDEAEAAYRQALARRPQDQKAYSNLLFGLSYAGHRAPEPLLREAAGWERAMLSADEREMAHAWRFDPAPRQGRPLRVGLLSAELGQHAVAYFLLPWLRALDPARVSLFLYPTKNRREPQVEAFRALDAVWTPLVGLSDAEAVDCIRADRIDVLIDTSGHTADNRLGVIARRAAPVQCHYIGYFATTGLSEMDWFIADPTLIPPELEAPFSERIWRLERPWMAYAPLEEAPEPAWRPDSDGTLWLGSFNNLSKVREDCLELWGRVLQALPQAKLLLKDGRSRDPATRERIRDRLVDAGMAAERLVFEGQNPSWREHMAQYDRLDIALDPIPMTGGSTAFDALWMGVPLVTLAGDRLIGRQGAAALMGLGRPEWIARDAEDYVRIVVELARDVEGRRAIRATQRERMRQSPLCDGVGMARALEGAFEGMFDRWWSRQ